MISWNWTRAYGIVQEQEQTIYEQGDIVMVMDQDMDSYDDAEVLAVVDGKVKVKLKTTQIIKDVSLCCIREQPAEESKQLYVHNQ